MLPGNVAGKEVMESCLLSVIVGTIEMIKITEHPRTRAGPLTLPTLEYMPSPTAMSQILQRPAPTCGDGLQPGLCEADHGPGGWGHRSLRSKTQRAASPCTVQQQQITRFLQQSCGLLPCHHETL